MRKVLIVEPNQQVNFFLTKLFDSLGFDVRTAENNADAFETYQQHLPSIIYCDVSLGLSFAEKVHSFDGNKVILMTSKNIEDAISQFSASSAVYMIVHKSDFMQELTPIINDYIEQQSFVLDSAS